MRQDAIAIVGMGCRFPGGADTPAAFWSLLERSADAVGPVPAARWDHAPWHSPDADAPGRTTQTRGGFLEDVAGFDAAFFGISPREAEAMDPQQRLLLEVAWEALEDAGIAPDSLDGSPTGVFLGLYNNNYGMIGRGSPDASLIGGWSASGTHTSIAAGRISYTLGLIGPALVVDTACSSSLVAVHLAVQALRRGECDLALAGGAHLILSPLSLVASSKLGAASPSGRCRAFDADADGFAHGEGCGVVVLRRLGDAVSAGERVCAVVRGTAVNQDGRSAGLTAPSGPAQEAVVRAALADAGLCPGEVDAVEAHGTGTALGDPVEMHALAAVFFGGGGGGGDGAGAGRVRPLAVGSVKSNIGHAEAAAGVAGLVKAALMLRHGAVPASLHFRRLNPHIGLGGAAIRVPTALEAAGAGSAAPLRRVGVSSFGFSGTNAHAVLEAPPPPEPVPPPAGPGPRAVPVSARGGAALAEAARRWGAALAAAAEAEAEAEAEASGAAGDGGGGGGAGRRRRRFAALCRSASGRAALPDRLCVVAAGAGEAAAALARAAAGAAGPAVAADAGPPAGPPRVAFLCPGQGAAFAGMAAGLAGAWPAFASVLARCDAAMGLGRPLAELFEDAAALRRTEVAQPALFALAAGLGALWRDWGVEPVAALGHSLGEYAAAHLAGVLGLEDAARLVAARGRAMASLLPAGEGAMASLLGPEAAARAALARHPEVELAAENGPSSRSVAGPAAAVAALLADPGLAAAGVSGQPLPGVGHAFHSRLVEPALDALERAAAAAEHRPPALPVVGCLTGAAVARHDAAYWRAQARAPVRFAAGLDSLAGLGATHLLELGPRPVLAALARAARPDRWPGPPRALASLPGPAPPRARPAPPPPRQARPGGPAAAVAAAGAAAEDAAARNRRGLLEAAAALWRGGAPLRWRRADPDPGPPGPPGPDTPEAAPAAPAEDAPTYPFQRQRFWLRDPTLDVAPHRPAPAPPSAAATVGDARVFGFYDELAGVAHNYADLADGTEGHLTFGLMRAPSPGFSWVRALFAGTREPEAYAMLRQAQAALKWAIFAPVDFAGARRVLDFGCGHAADLCAIALQHPHLRLDGCTISAAQVEVGRRRAERLGVADRVAIHHRDSGRDPFPGRYDVVFGIEVSGLIEDKAALFDNIRGHLEPGGALVIADFVSAGDSIANPGTASFTSTAEEWAALLSARGLRLTDCTDTSAEVANFLDDAGFAAEVERLAAEHGLSELTRRHLMSNHNIGRALRAGLMRYRLLVARDDRTAPAARLLAANRARLAAPDRWEEEGAAWRGWFHRLAWRPAAKEEALAAAREALVAQGEAAAATDRLARAYLGAARLAELRPVPRMARLHAHLLRFEASAEDPAGLPTPDLPEARLLRRCGPALRDALEGRADPLDLLFGDGGAAAESLYGASPFARAVNGVAAAAFRDLLGVRAGPARVLEIGAGTGGTTQALLPHLRPGDRYTVSDLSPGFVAAARRRFGLDGAVLDIAEDPAAQGFTPGSADILVAANVLHAVPDLRRALARAVSLLAPDGTLLLVENHGPILWGDLTFGLTDGMWAFTDTGLRPAHALLPPEAWASLLGEAGFDCAVDAPGDARTAALSGQFVLLARRRRADRRLWRLEDGPPPADATDLLWEAPAGAAADALLATAAAHLRDAAARANAPRVWMGTRGARAVEEGESADPAQAALWGLGNAVALEHPELRLSLVDGGDLAREAAAGGPETRVAHRGGRRLLARLERMEPPAAPASIGPEGTWLVTGGLQGVGLAVARWLATEGGARSIALASRRGDPVPDGFPPGAVATAHRCDVADEEELAALLAALAADRPPLVGVMHAAGVLDDAVLAQQDAARFAGALRPKLHAAALLDRLTRHLPIRHFVLFSSSAALLGSAAQANHAAANAALDALAERRRAEGLPALSIAWGAWGEVGAAARAGSGVARRGLLPMPPDEALAALHHAMAAERATIGVLDADWPRFLDRFAPHPVPPVFRDLAPVSAAPAPGSTAPPADVAAAAALPAALRSAAPEARAALLLAEVRRIAGRVLGLAEPPADAPLRELGLDSLMTVELRNALAAAAGARLPATVVFEHPTCAALAAHLGATVFAEDMPASTAPGDDPLAGLDEDELARLLEKELEAADGALGLAAR